MRLFFLLRRKLESLALSIIIFKRDGSFRQMLRQRVPPDGVFASYSTAETGVGGSPQDGRE